jgi:dTDP-4-dehydrorhamnose reductase
VYFSSEYVFDGHGGPYPEDAAPRPLQVYGHTKLEGERAVLEANPRSLVVRTGGVFGPERQGKNFVYQLWRKLRAGERLRVPGDQWGTPTFAPDLAAATVALVAAGHAGVVHVAGPDHCTRVELAQRACAALGLDGALVEPVTTAALAAPAARPLRAGLVCGVLERLGLPRPRPLDEGLRAMRAALSSASA